MCPEVNLKHFCHLVKVCKFLKVYYVFSFNLVADWGPDILNETILQIQQGDKVMIIGVCSDIHDNLENLRKMMTIYEERQVEAIVFCGDFCSPIPSRVITAEFKGDIHCVFGNGDGDRFLIAGVAKQNPHLKLYGQHAVVDFDGVKVAATHYPFYANALARTGDYQAVFSGHTHKANIERFGDCLNLNPGEVMGFTGEASCAVYETVKNEAEIILIK